MSHAMEQNDAERRTSHQLARAWLTENASGLLPDESFFGAAFLEGALNRAFRIDLTRGKDRPIISYLGMDLKKDCPDIKEGGHVFDGPFSSTFSNVAEHYLEAISARLPVEFEGRHAAGQNARYYRGVLLPLSHNGVEVSSIVGTVSWVEVH